MKFFPLLFTYEALIHSLVYLVMCLLGLAQAFKHRDVVFTSLTLSLVKRDLADISIKTFFCFFNELLGP